MPKYRVYLQTVASVSIEVEAEDKEAAIDAAFEEAPSGVCAQCSGWGRKWSLDVGEWGTEGFKVDTDTPDDEVVEEIEP